MIKLAKAFIVENLFRPDNRNRDIVMTNFASSSQRCACSNVDAADMAEYSRVI
jgi:hypothetical protein